MVVNLLLASLVVQLVKSPPAVQEAQVQSLGQEDPLEKKWQTTPIFLPGKSLGWRSLVGLQSMGYKRKTSKSRMDKVLDKEWTKPWLM